MDSDGKRIGSRWSGLRVLRRSAVVTALVFPAVSAPVRAQDAPIGGRGFLFQPPTYGLTFRAGMMAPLARSDVFSDARSLLTLGRGDLAGPSVGVDLTTFVTTHLQVGISADYEARSAGSEYRKWQGVGGTPIAQRTTLQRVPLLVSLRWYPITPGEQIGRFAWLPRRFTPFVGAMVGGVFFNYRQQGEFVDFARGNRIFDADLESDGLAFAMGGLAGLDVSLSPTKVLTTQLRASMARAPLGNQFQGFQPIDLSGVSLMVGLTIRYP